MGTNFGNTEHYFGGSPPYDEVPTGVYTSRVNMIRLRRAHFYHLSIFVTGIDWLVSLDPSSCAKYGRSR